MRRYVLGVLVSVSSPRSRWRREDLPTSGEPHTDPFNILILVWGDGLLLWLFLDGDVVLFGLRGKNA